MAELTVPQVDFSTLGALPQVYKQAQADQLRQQTLASLGQGGQADAAALLKSGDLSLANLGIQMQNRQSDQARQASQDLFQREEAARAQRNADRSYGLQVRSANRADEDKPTFKEIARPDGTTDIYRITRDGRAMRVDTGTSAPMNPADNPKNPLNVAMAKQDSERIAGYQDAAKTAETGMATLDQVDRLRKDAYTGPIVGRVADAIGVNANKAMAAANNELSLSTAQAMKGSLSDKDVAFVKSQGQSSTNNEPANAAISSFQRAALERTKQRGSFYRSYFEKTGSVKGADQAWNRYINENELTVEDKGTVGGRKFNPEYNKDFSKYLQVGAPAQQPQQGISQQEYAALPSGTPYTAPDGSQRIKP